MDPSLSLLPVVWSQRSMNFLKIQVIQDKSKPTRVAMIWLRVKVNRTRLCTAVHFARNKIKYQKSRENGLFQYKLYACTIACLSFISLYKGSFTNVTARCLLHRNRRKAKNYHSQYLWQKRNLVTFRYSSRDIKGLPRSRAVRLRIILAFHIALMYYTQDFRCTRGHVTSQCQGLFSPHPFFKGKALGTRLSTRGIVHLQIGN